MMLLNPYGVDMGTSGLIIQAQSREEIYADKLVAFALRPNRVKYRDLWDILWLHQQGLKPKIELIPHKLQDRNYTVKNFLRLFEERKKILIENSDSALAFQQEMQRFLPNEQITKVIEKKELWDFIIYLIEDLSNQIRNTTRYSR